MKRKKEKFNQVLWTEVKMADSKRKQQSFMQ